MSTNTVQKSGGDFLSLLNSKQTDAQLAKILPANLTVERFKRIVRTAWLRNHDLQILEPASIMLSVMTLASLGLEPDGRKAYLIPFKGKAVGMPGYMGYIDRARENGLIGIHFDNVFFNDVFQWDITGDGLQFKHSPHIKTPDRGEMFASYCIWREGEGRPLQGVIMTRLEIEKIRDASPGKNQDPWRIHFLEMSKKTTIRRAQKQWPLDVKLDEAIKAGKLVDSSTIDIESEIVPEIPTAAPSDDSNPELHPAPVAQGTAESYKQILAANVPLDMFAAEIKMRNIALDSDSWQSFETVPAGVWESLSNQPKVLQAIIKKWGKKPE